MKVCSKEDCTRKVFARNLCGKHYTYFIRHGGKYIRPKSDLCANCRRAPRKLGREFCCERCDNKKTPRGRKGHHWRNLKRYGLGHEEYWELLIRQSGRCAICCRVAKNLHVDHDHSCCKEQRQCCGKCVRGLLCGSCNRALGLFGERFEVLTAAVEYLKVAPHQSAAAAP